MAPPSADRPRIKHRVADRVWRPGAGWGIVERGVAWAIAAHFGENDFAYPSMSRIAAVAGCSERTARKVVRVLVEGDEKRSLLPLYVRAARRGQDGRPHGYVYRFVNNPAALL